LIIFSVTLWQQQRSLSHLSCEELMGSGSWVLALETIDVNWPV
jgi:hypothetical protein